jgi:insulysin
MLPLPPRSAAAANRTAPVLLVDRPGARLWWKQDFNYPGKNWEAKPKVNAMFQVTAPYSDVTARSAVLTTLWTMLYNDALVETTYDASVAGLSWGLSPSGDGLRITVAGYGDKLLLLLKQVTDPMVTCLRENSQCMWAKAKRFEVIKDELRRGLENSKKMSPYARAMERMSHLLQKRVWSTDRLLYELSLPNVDLDSVAEHAKEMLSRTYMEGFVHGNADADMARACLEQISRALASFPLPDTEREVQEIVKLNSGLLFADAHTNSEDLNHALELYYQVPCLYVRVGGQDDVCGCCRSRCVGPSEQGMPLMYSHTRCRGKGSTKMLSQRCWAR